MRELSETASALTIHYPLWMGPLSLLVGYAVAGWLLKDRKGSVQRLIAGIGGIIIVSIVGFGAMFDGVTLDATGVRDTRILAGAHAVAWKDVAEVHLEDRKSGRRGMQPHLVLRLAPHGETAMDISGLDRGEIERVVAFARKRAVGG